MYVPTKEKFAYCLWICACEYQLCVCVSHQIDACMYTGNVGVARERSGAREEQIPSLCSHFSS